jgi:hypothetical protein
MGQRCEPKALLCVVDEGPVVTVLNPAAMTVASGSTLRLEGFVHDDSDAGVTLSFSTDDNHWNALAVGAAGHFETELTLPSADFEPLNINLQAIDTLGNATFHQIPLTADNIAPRCGIFSPPDGGFLNGNGSTFFRLMMNDGSPTLHMEASVDKKPIPVSRLDGIVSAHWNDPPKEDGSPHTFRYSATDPGGNSCSGQAVFLLDNVPPSLSVTQPMSDAVLGLPWFDGGAWVTGPTPDDGLNPTPTVTVDWDDGLGARLATTIDGGYRFPVSPTTEDMKLHQVKVTATDWAGNAKTITVPVTVDTVAPVISFLSPDAGAQFNAASFNGAQDVTVNFAVVDGDPMRTVSVNVDGLTFIMTSASSVDVPTASTDNPKNYRVTVRANDTAGNQAERALDFSVDRVAPTLTGTVPANDTRNFDSTSPITVSFSEPMGGNGPALNGFALGAGSWNGARTQWSVGPLSADTVYNVTVASVSDAYGNPMVGGAPSLRFSTAPFRPAAGTLFNDVEHFAAVSDPDGALSIFLESATLPRTYQWGRVNAKSGQFEVLWNDVDTSAPPYFISQWQVAAWRIPQPDFTAQRIVGMTTLSNAMFNPREAHWKIDAAAGQGVMGATAVIPMPPLPGEAAGAGAVGYIIGSDYLRSGRPPITLGLTPTQILYTDRYIEMIAMTPPNGTSQAYDCVDNGPLGINCALGAVVSFASDAYSEPNFQAVTTPECTVFVYDTIAQQRKSRFAFHGLCTTPPFCPPAPRVEFAVASEETRYAATFVGEGLLRARRGASGVELATRDCYSAGSWTPIGAAVTVPPMHMFQPIVSGGKLGLLYVSQNNALTLYWAN